MYDARQSRATYARFKYYYILRYYDSDGRIVSLKQNILYAVRFSGMPRIPFLHSNYAKRAGEK